MKAIKRTVAALLATLMLATSTSFTLAAEEYSDKEAVVVAKVNAAGIMTGTDKGFEPSKTLTRAEAAAIMVRMKGISEATVKQNAGTTLFSDVNASHWAAGYVNVASNYNIIKGVGAGLFAPDKEVSVAEFYTMAVRALNAGQLVEAEGTWPTNYVNFAIENGLAEDVAQVYSVPATRMTAATIVANTLDAKMWKKKSVVTNGEITWTESDETILYNTLNIVELTASFSAIDTKEYEVTYASATDAEGNAVTPKKDVNEEVALSTAKIGVTYTVWYDVKEEELLGFVVPASTDAVSFTAVKKWAASGKVKLLVDGSEKEYTLADEFDIYLNGAKLADETDNTEDTLTEDPDGDSDIDLPFDYKGVAYLNDDNEIDKIYAETYKFWGVVDEVKSNKVTFKSVEGDASEVIWIDTKNKEYSVTKNGKTIEISDVEEGDALYWYTNASKTKYTVEVINDTVEGKVKSENDTTRKYSIDGKSYTAYKYDTAIDINVKNEGTFYLLNGKIAMFLAEEGSIGNVAIISAMKEVNGEISGETQKYVKYITMDGVESDWVEMHDDETTLVGDFDAAAASTTVGTMVAYEIKSGKFLTKDNEDNKARDIFGTVTAYKANDNKEKAYVTVAFSTESSNDGDYKLASDAVIYELTTETSATKVLKNTAELKEVDFDDLDDITSGLTQAYASGIDYEDGTVKFIVLDKTNISVDRKWAYVIAKSSYDDDDDSTDENEQYEVVFAGESESVLLLAKDLKDNKGTPVAVAAGNVYELAVVDGVIKNAKNTFTSGAVLDAKATPAQAINKQYSNGDIMFNSNGESVGDEVATTGTRLEVADDVIVIKKDKVSSFGALRFLEKGTGVDDKVTQEDLDNSDIINEYFTQTEDGVTTIIAIVFGK